MDAKPAPNIIPAWRKKIIELLLMPRSILGNYEKRSPAFSLFFSLPPSYFLLEILKGLTVAAIAICSGGVQKVFDRDLLSNRLSNRAQNRIAIRAQNHKKPRWNSLLPLWKHPSRSDDHQMTEIAWNLLKIMLEHSISKSETTRSRLWRALINARTLFYVIERIFCACLCRRPCAHLGLSWAEPISPGFFFFVVVFSVLGFGHLGWVLRCSGLFLNWVYGWIGLHTQGKYRAFPVTCVLEFPFCQNCNTNLII